VALVLFAAMQLVRPERTNPAVQADLDAPPSVRQILRRSCYDCHSHETRWPWYSHVAPVSWWLANHVQHARGDLNFSRWPIYDLAEQEELRGEIAEQVESGEMPLRSDLILHPGAGLSPEDRRVLLEWAGAAP
jgi:hypothetical protein